MNEYGKRFIALLKTIFELDKSDLDFGIYRIMNIRRREIEEYLQNRLPKKINEILLPFASAGKDEILQKIAQIESNVASMGMTIDQLADNAAVKQEYLQLKSQLAQGTDISALESDVYSALFNFFNRYYDEGDFISKRRYKEGVYAIPYEGEEVKLYWANQDQYYIKTSENFKDYTFTADDNITVHFRLVDATTEQNNNKEQEDSKRVFMLYAESEEHPELKTFEWDAESKELFIRFVYDIPADKKKKYDEINYKAIREWLVDYPALMLSLLNPSKPGIPDSDPVILKHLKAYVAKNTFDYFIHKDLGGFLNRELDFFIKNEIMHLDDLDTSDEHRAETYLAKVRAVKRIGKEIIAFLAQIENYQRKLWLKKKFVVETNWCVTLDRIDESFYSEIIANEKQIQEWIDMYRIDDLIEGELQHTAFTNPPSMEFLRENQNLIVDTANFDSIFRDRLIASINDLDKNTGGLMINSDNFHALRVLNSKYHDKINAIYTDPPYNTDASKILYKNGYEHSSWISLMHSRLLEAKKLLSLEGVISIAIDDFEMRYLNCCMEEVFNAENSISNIAIFTNPKGRDQGFVAQSHDYSLVYSKDKRFATTYNFILSEEEMAKKYTQSKNGEALRELPLKRTGTGKFRTERPYMFFPFFFNEDSNTLKVIEKDAYERIYNKEQNLFNDDFLEQYCLKQRELGFEPVFPISRNGVYLRWRWGYDSCVKGVDNGILFCKKTKSGYAIYQYDFADEEARPKSMWINERYDASSKGTNILESIIPNCPFKYPKSIYTVEDNIILISNDNDIILDFFAGAATTSHAVLHLNRTIESSNRKYILVDMAEYFNSVTLARTKKTIYSNTWSNGIPQRRDDGVSHIMKYMRLESYEDALSNIKFEEKGGLGGMFGDEYLINYMLDIETKGSLLNLEAFNSPFDYEMNITEKNECHRRKVDVVETFNYLIGLTVASQSAISYFKTASATNPAYEGAVDLVKDNNGEYAFRQIEGTLPDGRRALVIWRNIKADNLTASNAALDAYFSRYRINPQDREYDVIFVNGDSNVENLRLDNESWKVVRTESEFNRQMWTE